MVGTSPGSPRMEENRWESQNSTRVVALNKKKTFSYTIFIFVTFITHYSYFSVISAMHYTKRTHQYWYPYALCQSGSKLGIIRMEDRNLITSPHFSLLTRQFTVWCHITQNYFLSIFLSSCNTLDDVGLSEFLLIFQTQIFTKAKLN